MRNGLVVLLLAAGVSVITGILGVQPTHAASLQQKGVSIQPRSNTDFASASFRQSVDNAVKSGVNYITLVVPVHQDNIYSSSVYGGPDTPTESALTSGLSYIKSKGIGAGIAVHDNPYDGQWRAMINAGDKASWFTSYSQLLNRFGTIAQSAGASQIIIGTELSSMTNQGNTSYWQSMIASLRQRFSGSLTYSAQHAGYMSDAQTLGFWPQLDVIGISAYYDLGYDSSVDSLKRSWDNWNQQEVSKLASQYGKSIIFTEVGFVSRDNGTSDPGNGYTYNTGANQILQANAYQALFAYWNNYSTVTGMFLWDWSSDPSAGGSGDRGYTPQNKPAQDVMRQYFKDGTSTSTPSPATPTTPVAPKPVDSPTFTVTSAGESQLNVNASTQLPVTVQSSVPTSDAVVDIELYDEAGNRVMQKFYEQQGLSSNGLTYTVNWRPTVAGKYIVKVGVFSKNWQKALYWNNQLAVVTVTQPIVPPALQPAPIQAPVPSPSVPTPQPSTPTTSQPAAPVQPAPVTPSTPASPMQPQQPKDITVWWPGSTVSGVQPFKALIDGRDVSTYDLYWQVDGGMMNKMENNPTPIMHKESDVDLSIWRWSQAGNYTITFTAKDTSGNIISQKPVTVRVI